MLKFRPFCGNSSVVEHDLAKVGVASSNLVSRSILLCLTLLFTSLNASSVVYLQKNYCINEDVLKSSFFGYNGFPEIVIVTVPKERAQYTLPSSTLLNTFADKNITVIDSSEGTVTFKRHCALMGKADILETAFLQKFQEAFPHVRIEGKPMISIKSSLPNDFAHYRLEAISLPPNTLHKKSGSFTALFSVGDKKKKMTFYYEMDAKVLAFKARRNLQSGKILQNDDVEALLVDIDTLPSKPIVGEIPSNLIVKNSIKEGQILGGYFFETKKDVMKKDSIKVYFIDGPLVIELNAIVLDDANIGDVVKVKTDQGKVLNAKILSINEAKILE